MGGGGQGNYRVFLKSKGCYIWKRRISSLRWTKDSIRIEVVIAIWCFSRRSPVILVDRYSSHIYLFFQCSGERYYRILLATYSLYLPQLTLQLLYNYIVTFSPGSVHIFIFIKNWKSKYHIRFLDTKENM